MSGQPLPEVGQKVNARIDLISDLRDDGLGIEVCAKRGDDLIVRRITDGFICVSHEDITDRSFSVKLDEIDYVYPKGTP